MPAPVLYDWGLLRRRFVGENLSLRDLSQLENAPDYGSLRNRCGAEKWVAERKALNDRIVAKTREVTVTIEAEVAARHVKIAQALQAKALQALQKLDVMKLKPSEIREFLATATDIERKALGMDNKFTLKGVGDLAKLSDAELLTLAHRAGIHGDAEQGVITA